MHVLARLYFIAMESVLLPGRASQPTTSMKTLFVTILLVASMGLFARCSTTKPPGETPAPEASYVFRGTVTAPRSSTLEQLPANAQTYTVRVDETFLQKGNFNDQTGNRITILTQDENLQAGRQYVIYAEPFMFGESIAVRLIEAIEDTRSGSTIAEEVRQAHERHTLRERVHEAEVIVVGAVVRIDTVGQAQRFESEHLPDLQQAFLNVDRVLKGDLTPDEVSFLFAASRDVHWYRAPKFNGGERGIFLLNIDSEAAATFGMAGGSFTLLHPLDFQPPDKEEIIKSLL